MEGANGFMPYINMECNANSSRIWALRIDSIFFDNNRYANIVSNL